MNLDHNPWTPDDRYDLCSRPIDGDIRSEADPSINDQSIVGAIDRYGATCCQLDQVACGAKGDRTKHRYGAGRGHESTLEVEASISGAYEGELSNGLQVEGPTIQSNQVRVTEDIGVLRARCSNADDYPSTNDGSNFDGAADNRDTATTFREPPGRNLEAFRLIAYRSHPFKRRLSVGIDRYECKRPIPSFLSNLGHSLQHGPPNLSGLEHAACDGLLGRLTAALRWLLTGTRPVWRLDRQWQ